MLHAATPPFAQSLFELHGTLPQVALIGLAETAMQLSAISTQTHAKAIGRMTSGRDNEQILQPSL